MRVDGGSSMASSACMHAPACVALPHLPQDHEAGKECSDDGDEDVDQSKGLESKGGLWEYHLHISHGGLTKHLQSQEHVGSHTIHII